MRGLIPESAGLYVKLRALLFWPSVFAGEEDTAQRIDTVASNTHLTAAVLTIWGLLRLSVESYALMSVFDFLDMSKLPRRSEMVK